MPPWRVAAIEDLPLHDSKSGPLPNNARMSGGATMPHEGFTTEHRVFGRTAAWAAFVVGQAYAVAALFGFVSLKSPQDPIGDPFLSIMAFLLVLMAPLMVASMVVVHAYASPDRKACSLTALVFMILLAGITSSVNFAILIVSHRIETAGSSWLTLFLPYQWPSVAYSLDILAWDWFFALSMLFAAPVFRGGTLRKTVRLLMIVTGVLSLVGFAGVAFADVRVLSIGILGYGVAAPVVFLLLGILFGRTQSLPGDTERGA
jgi:hypothetical protein